LQIDIINNEIRNAKKAVLLGKSLIDDPMERIVEAHDAACVHVGMANADRLGSLV
jgi:hypothetical protein